MPAHVASLARRPRGLLSESDFQWHEEGAPSLDPGQVLVRNVYLSLDPTNRVWAATRSYLPAVKVGDVMRGIAVGVVVFRFLPTWVCSVTSD